VVGNFQAGEQLFLCLRPEDITVSLPGVEGAKSSACNQLQGKALKITPWGAHYRVALSCGENRLVAFITRPAFLELKIAEGDEVVASFNASAVHVIKRS
jgi:tungstate transport system ATP-binding protein